MSFSYTWNAAFLATPPDSAPASQGATRIRELKISIGERISVDHSLAGDANDGKHKQVTLTELATKPTVAAGFGAMYCKDASGSTVPYFEDDAAAEHIIALMDKVYPVGSIYINASVATNPATLLGFGTWTAFGTGRALVSLDATNSLMNTAEETFGSANAIVVTHNHTVSDHHHSNGIVPSSGSRTAYPGVAANSAGYQTSVGVVGGLTGDTTLTIANAGSSGTNANYQPSIAVYMWKRTA